MLYLREAFFTHLPDLLLRYPLGHRALLTRDRDRDREDFFTHLPDLLLRVPLGHRALLTRDREDFFTHLPDLLLRVPLGHGVLRRLRRDRDREDFFTHLPDLLLRVPLGHLLFTEFKLFFNFLTAFCASLDFFEAFLAAFILSFFCFGVVARDAVTL